MAERLAPLTVVAPIRSRPEQSLRRKLRWPRRMLVAVVILVLAAAGAVATAHFLSIERRAHEIRATSLVPLGMPARVLVVVARPGQELPMAGTLVALHEAGSEVRLLSLTSPGPGPATPTAKQAAEAAAATASKAGGLPADGAVPTSLTQAAARLGLADVSVAGFVPGELMVADPSVVTARIRQAIAATKPSAVLTISDTTGGDRDSQAVAGYTIAAVGQAGSPVARVWTVTRGRWERDFQAIAGDTVADQRVPTPQVAVRLHDGVTAGKLTALAAYAAESPELVRASYPYSDVLPGDAYFRFWDREYFALAWGEPVD